MLFTASAHAGVADGTITTTYRFWKRPHAKVGGRYRVGAVTIEVDSIELIPFGVIAETDLAATGLASLDELRSLVAHAGPVGDDTLVHRIDFRCVGTVERAAPNLTPESIAVAQTKLAAIDRRSPSGPWTAGVLRLIGDHPGVVSTELATRLDLERMKFKADVRKLKALGLTESLEVGYRLTALGQAVLAP